LLKYKEGNPVFHFPKHFILENFKQNSREKKKINPNVPSPCFNDYQGFAIFFHLSSPHLLATPAEVF
jgi:hypothetical protein